MSFEWKNIGFQKKLCRYNLEEEGQWEGQEVDGRMQCELMQNVLGIRHWKTAARNREEWRKRCVEARARFGIVFKMKFWVII
jgi:hypothetical protein